MAKWSSEAFNGSLNQNKDLVGRFCRRPFELLEIHRHLEAYPCCPSWLSTIVGNVEHDDIMNTWNSQNMQEIRRSIVDGDFRFCEQAQCPYIQADSLPKKEDIVKESFYESIIKEQNYILDTPPSEIALCYDLTCNLSCPSCRTSKIALISGPEYERKVLFTNKLLKFLDHHTKKHQITLRVTGSGDPIASPIFLSLLKRLNKVDHPKLKVCLQSNGTMITPVIWEQLKNIHELLSFISISIDAASEETYRIVRRGGHWVQLQKNLRFLSGLKAEKKLNGFSFNFVTQKENFFEIPDFVRMGIDLNVSHIFFSFVSDWGTWSKEDFEKQCVWKLDHPNFPDLMRVLSSPILDHPCVFLGNLTHYRNLALKMAAPSLTDSEIVHRANEL